MVIGLEQNASVGPPDEALRVTEIRIWGTKPSLNYPAIQPTVRE